MRFALHDGHDVTTVRRHEESVDQLSSSCRLGPSRFRGSAPARSSVECERHSETPVSPVKSWQRAALKSSRTFDHPQGGEHKGASSPTRRQAQGGRAGSGRVHLYVGISLDGYIAAPDGGVDWLNPYADARSGFMPFIKTIGRLSWAARPTTPRRRRGGYASFGKMPTFVVTHRPFTSKSPLVIPFTGELSSLVEDIRQRYPGDIWLMGGGGVTKSFQDADLIDIWSVAFVPAFLSDGLPMFPRSAFTERSLRLVRHHIYPSGVVELSYERFAEN